MLERRIKHIRLILIVVGILGTIAFFPFNFNENYTCLYHRLFCDMEEDHQIKSTNGHVHGDQEFHNATLNLYIQHFSYYWWGSLLVLAMGIYLPRLVTLLKNHQKFYAFRDDDEIKF